MIFDGNFTPDPAPANILVSDPRPLQHRSAGVNTGKILRFSFGPGAGVKNFWKSGPGTGVTLQFQQ